MTTKNIVPRAASEGSIGTDLKPWGAMVADRINAGNLAGVYNCIADAKANRKLKVGDSFVTLGYYEPNDGGGGVYVVRSRLVTDSEDGGAVHFTAGGQTAVLQTCGSANVMQFGARGDAVHDDGGALQRAFDWSKKTKCPVYLSERLYYTEQTLDAGGAIIRSVSGSPGGASPMWRKKPDGSYVTGSPNWDYFYGASYEGKNYSWQRMINDTAYGPAIVSDVDAPILFAGDGQSFDVSGFAVVGDHRKHNQDGLATATPHAYSGNTQSINNISVIGCGRDGIHLQRGLECTKMDSVKCIACNGYGLFTGFNEGVDSATDYLEFNNCTFTYNRLSGVYLSHWRKNIEFHFCNLSGNGQYGAPIAIDPLLGYDRTVPDLAEDMHAGIWVDSVSRDIGQGFGYGFVVDGCYGEEMAVGVHFKFKGVSRDIRLQNNAWIASPAVTKSHASGKENGYGFFFDLGYTYDWLVSGNSAKAIGDYKLKNVPSGRDSYISMLFLDGGAPLSTAAEKEFFKFDVRQPIESGSYMRSNGRLYGNQVLFLNAGREISQHTFSVRDIATDFTVSAGNLTSNKVAVYSLTAHWASTNNTYFGGYLLFVTKMPAGEYVMLTIAMSSTRGFTGVPSMATDGTLNISAAGHYCFTLQRIDNILTNGQP